MPKSRKQLNLERRRKRNSERGKYGNEVKRRRMLERAKPLEVVGSMITSGVFGEHEIELLTSDNEELHVWLRVDGEIRKARTLRGVQRITNGWIWKKGNVIKTTTEVWSYQI